MSEFKLVDEQCADCGYPMPRGSKYRVRDPITRHARRICGFCWCNPGWPMLDPEYRERQIRNHRRRYYVRFPTAELGLNTTVSARR